MFTSLFIMIFVIDDDNVHQDSQQDDDDDVDRKEKRMGVVQVDLLLGKKGVAAERS